MTVLKQLQEWVNGNSIHNEERDECCPDFSCCNHAVNTDIKTRKAFMSAHINENEKLKTQMLYGFLGVAMSLYNNRQKVYVAGNDQTNAN